MNSRPRKKLLVVNQYYAPDLAATGQIAADICEDLVQQSIETYVITGKPSYASFSPEAPEFEKLNGVKVSNK